MNGHGSPLRHALDAAIAESGGSMKNYTVLSTQHDPFRVDTPANHRDGKWLADTAADLGLGDRTIHLRGLHYMVIGRTKPNGLPYTNTEADWLWLSGSAGKSARWLGYIPFEQIVDNRNTPPTIRQFIDPYPLPYLNVGIEVEIPDADDLMPRIGVSEFRGSQPFKLVFFGEKSSLLDVISPLADAYGVDIYLPTGEISDTMMHQMASVARDDGRPMRVFTLSDADPAGWQMPISIGRKLQAFQALGYEFEFEVHRVALTPDQVREYGLPSTPLKATEKRANAWRSEMGVDQTEIDALASLQPALLRRIVREAIKPFYDSGLDARVRAARNQWEAEAQAIIDQSMDDERLTRIKVEAAAKLDELRTEVDTINDALRVDVDDFDLPDIVVPEAETGDPEDYPLPLIDSAWSFPEQCQALIDSKAYRS